MLTDITALKVLQFSSRLITSQEDFVSLVSIVNRVSSCLAPLEPTSPEKAASSARPALLATSVPKELLSQPSALNWDTVNKAQDK